MKMETKMGFDIFSKTLDNFNFWIHKTFGSDSVSLDISAKSFRRDPEPFGTSGLFVFHETDRDGNRHVVCNKLDKTWSDKNEVIESFQVAYRGLDTIDEAKKNILEYWETWKLENFDTLEVKVKQYGRNVINLSGTVESVKLELIENKTFSESLKWDEYL